MSEEIVSPKGEDNLKREPDPGGCCGGGLRAKGKRINATADRILEDINSVLKECGKNQNDPPEDSCPQE